MNPVNFVLDTYFLMLNKAFFEEIILKSDIEFLGIPSLLKVRQSVNALICKMQVCQRVQRKMIQMK